MIKAEVILVGQGITGTMMSHALHKRHINHIVIDPGLPSASSVATGLINPVTGRKWVKSWRVDELLPFARTAYENLEKVLGMKLFEERRILRAMNSIGEQNEVLSKIESESFALYVKEAREKALSRFPERPVAAAIIDKVIWLNMPALINAYREYLVNKNLFIQESIVHEQLIVEKDMVRYLNVEAKKIIFTEGYQVLINPWFHDLPWNPAKGEVLIVKIEDQPSDIILKNGMFLIPVGEGIFWLGSTFINEFDYSTPSPLGRNKLIDGLKKITSNNYQVLEHWAGIRPATIDRRPIIGCHSKNSNVVLFNGMGSKGASLAPFFAEHLCAHLFDNAELDPDIDIKRFQA